MSTTGNIDRNDEGPPLGVPSLSLDQSPQQQQQQQQQQQPPHYHQAPHKAVVLFYKYWIPTTHNNPGFPCSSGSAVDWLRLHPDFYLPHIYIFQKELCHRLGLKGRILLATEGINATLSATSVEVLAEYRTAVESYDLLATAGYPPSYNDNDDPEIIPKNDDNPSIFAGIDWKESLLVAADDHDNNGTTTTTKAGITTQPFPNLKVTIVKELVSSGNRISVQDLQVDGRSTHLSPHDFHHKLLTDPNVVLVDVRNTFEYNIGHFVHPHTHHPAMNPEMVTFSSFDKQFCQPHASLLQDKTVLMYCTGGIRCEKASVMLQQRGVASVYQLQGGIHRYLETFGETGCFKGKNFQFDQRVSLTPSQQYQQRRLLDNYNNNTNNTNNNNIIVHNNPPNKEETTLHDKDAPLRPHTVVGTCIECRADYDELSGARICTVCRDLVLVCPTCQETLREYHCQRHAEWKAYFTFLEVFDYHELQAQQTSLQELLTRKHNDYSKHVRKTLRQQIDKISQRMEELQTNPALVTPNAPRRCRSCRELQGVVCNGLCWGFWKTTGATREPSNNQTLPITTTTTTTTTTIAMSLNDPIRPIQVGDVVTPGPHWNEIRYGSRINPQTGRPLEGIVAEIKSWGTGSDELDCVAVEWNDADRLPRQRQVQIYRWGAKAVNGSRLYDVCMSELNCH